MTIVPPKGTTFGAAPLNRNVRRPIEWIVIRAIVFALLAALAIEGRACVVSAEAVILKDPIAAMNGADAVFYATVRRWTKIDESTAFG